MAVTRATARMMQALLGPGGVQDQAEAAVRQALAADPGDTAVLWKLGEIHRRQGNLAAAHDVYRRLAALGPDRRKASWLSASLGGGRLPETVVPRGVWPAPFVRMTSFLTSEQCDRLMALAYAERGRLLSARVGLGKGSRVDPEARITFEADAQVRRDVGPWFLPKLRSAVPEVLARLRMEGDDQYDVQHWNMRVYPAGGFYSAHHDAVANQKPGLTPNLLQLEGVGVANAGELMVAAGENPHRLRSEASFAMMCGACPIPASSGKTQRHRLNRGGNRQANSALHMVVVCRMRTDPRTRAYVERRTHQGLSKREVMRCLKRYVAREIYRVLTVPPAT